MKSYAMHGWDNMVSLLFIASISHYCFHICFTLKEIRESRNSQLSDFLVAGAGIEPATS